MDLSGLPLDIRFLILTQPGLLPYAPYVPGELGRLASKVYYQKYGEVAISKSEIIEYIRRDQPLFIALISFGTIPDEWDKYYQMDVDIFASEQDLTGYRYMFRCAGIYIHINANIWGTELYQFDHNHALDGEGYSLSNIEKDINRYSDTIDLYSQYQTLRRRSGCMRINPQFASETVRQIFEQIINNEFQTWSPYPILNQVKLSLWLETNIQVITRTTTQSDGISIALPPPIIAHGDVTIITEPLSQEGEMIMDTVKIRNREMMAQLQSLMSEW